MVIFPWLNIIKNGNVELNFLLKFGARGKKKKRRKQLCLDEDPKLNLKIDHMVFYGGVLSVRVFTAEVMRNPVILTSH